VDPGFGERDARGGHQLFLRDSASLYPALLHSLPQAVDLDQHIVRISKRLVPLVANPA
jgi:hypothetical protein